MCPWKQIRQEAGDRGIMDEGVWAALRPYLPSTRAIDFTGGGEPLLQPRLDDWLSEAKAAGCETGFLSNGLLLDPERGKRIMDTGLDWICFSVDGTTAAVYEEIRLGSDFQRVCDNIAGFSSLRPGIAPRIMINFVMMPANVHQLEDIVRLAAKLGVDQVNFKQCDVVRGEHGSGFALFAGTRTKEVRKMEKALGRARRLARKFKICATAFSFSPKEQSVCDQDPRNSLFVRYDGSVAPCINLAIGGPSTFLGKPVTMPTVHYGRLPDADLNDLWKTDTCRFYRELFEARVDAHDRQLARSDLNEASLPKLNEALQAAIDAMPDPPEGCSVCHYLYGI
jgi:MoaA/NifB/PqqE/SkfB family radical SAM enzyme